MSFGENPSFETVKIPKVSLCDSQNLRKIKFGNFMRSKSAILVIFEATEFGFGENFTFESEKITKIPIFLTK